MNDEKRPRANSTTPHEPQRPVDAVVDDVQSNQALSANPDRVIVAFEVALVRNRSRIMLSTALKDGSAFTVQERVTADTLEAFDLLIPLPIKDLANPGVALVVRSSLERLVKAARNAVAGDCALDVEVDRELDAALEPFAEVGRE